MAYKEKENDYKRLERDIKNTGLTKAKMILLYGHEEYLVKTYEKRIRELFIQPATADLDYIRLDGDSSSTDEIISNLDTLPMFSQKRVVTVNNYPAMKKTSGNNEVKPEGGYSNESDNKRLLEYMELIPDTSLLILASSDIDPRKSFSKKVLKSDYVYNFTRLNQKDLSSFIKKRFRESGKNIDDSLVREIINTTGYFERDSDYTLNEIANDVVKITSFSQDTEIIQADISSVLSTSIETDAFALLDSLSSGDKSQAMLLVNNIMDNGENSFRILGLIISQFELMLSIKEYSARKQNPKEIKKTLGIKSDFRYKKLTSYLNKFSIEDLENILLDLYSVDKNIKTGIYNDRLAMMMFVAGL